MKEVREARKRLTRKLGINIERPHCVNLQLRCLKRLPTPYPPVGAAICENLTIYGMWQKHCTKTKHPNTRDGKPLPHWSDLVMLDEDRLQYIVDTTESVVIRDADDYSKIVAVVIRDFCPVKGVIDWVNSVIDKNVNERRNIRVCAFYSLFWSKPKLI